MSEGFEMAEAQRTIEAAAHKPHGKRHRGREVLLEVDTTRNGLPFWLRREREIYLAGVQNRIEAARRAVREPPKGDVDPAYFSTATPWLVPKPKPIRVTVASLVRRAEASTKTARDAAIVLRRLAEAARAENPRMAHGLFVEAGDHYLRARSRLLRACAGEMFANAAALAKKSSVASGLRERAGDAFSRAVDQVEGGHTGHEEAWKQYRLAAYLVRKTDPERARMLNEKADAVRSGMEGAADY